MVNRGRSGGCVTCKQRRVKCDEAKPICRLCQRLGLRCGGYGTKYANLKFKGQNYKFNTGIIQSRISCPRPPAECDTAVPFFLDHYAKMGRDLRSARGFFEVLIPVYCSQSNNSALSLAVSAVASETLSLWRHSPDGLRWSQDIYTEAITCLRNAIKDRSERGKEATALAVLSLQLYENIAAIYGLRSATRIHHDGAVSLLPFGDSDNQMTGAYIRKFTLHAEISSAIRQKRPLQDIAYSWIGSKDLIFAPDNPSSALDIIGASVVALQTSYMQLLMRDTSEALSRSALKELVSKARRTDEQLLVWARSVPDYWQPVKIFSGIDVDPSIQTYRSICEVYPSCQIAAIWNLWRVQRILLIKITISSLDKFFYPTQSEHPNDQTFSEINSAAKYKQMSQDLVDSICYSIPFYLGNRTKCSTIADFTDPAILLPSYDSLGEGDKTRLIERNDDHRRHIIAQGPWHAMSPLSRLLTLFVEEYGRHMLSFLRPGQHEWICEQFLRVITLLNIPPLESGTAEDGCRISNSSNNESVNTQAEHIAKRVRKGLNFMSGP
ncbi:hypothetical protein Plec18170_001793 [Paecilomyces lecythidis]